MSISPSSIHSIHSREDFLRFLSSELAWPIPDDLSFEDVTFDVYPDELGIRREDLRGSTIAQIRPFVQDQPWGIFVLQLQQPRLYLTELRRVLRALEPMKRKLKDFKTWNPQHVLFICTNDWKNYTFAHFEGEVAPKGKNLHLRMGISIRFYPHPLRVQHSASGIPARKRYVRA